MTPTTAELLDGCVKAIATPPEAEDLALYLKGRLSLVVLVNILAAQEAEGGVAARVAENAALRAVLGDASAAEDDLTIAGLDAVNAALRRRLIALHTAVEEAGDRTRDREILALYRRMAALRELVLPPIPAAA